MNRQLHHALSGVALLVFFGACLFLVEQMRSCLG